jgi:hypothetical protein
MARGLICVVLQLLLLVPVGLAGKASRMSCACGMQQGHCSCALQGKMGRCSMRPIQPADFQLTPTGKDLRGWLEILPPCGLSPDPAPRVSLARGDLLPASAFQSPPDPPPPRGLPSRG